MQGVAAIRPRGQVHEAVHRGRQHVEGQPLPQVDVVVADVLAQVADRHGHDHGEDRRDREAFLHVDGVAFGQERVGQRLVDAGGVQHDGLAGHRFRHDEVAVGRPTVGSRRLPIRGHLVQPDALGDGRLAAQHFVGKGRLQQVLVVELVAVR